MLTDGYRCAINTAAVRGYIILDSHTRTHIPRSSGRGTGLGTCDALSSHHVQTPSLSPVGGGPKYGPGTSRGWWRFRVCHCYKKKKKYNNEVFECYCKLKHVMSVISDRYLVDGSGFGISEGRSSHQMWGLCLKGFERWLTVRLCQRWWSRCQTHIYSDVNNHASTSLWRRWRRSTRLWLEP